MRREMDGMKAEKLSQRQIIKELKRNEYKVAPGKAWSQMQLQHAIVRMKTSSPTK